MAVEKIRGLVLKIKNINENDKYLTVLCEEYGKISFKASGVRNFKSKYIASAQPFAYSEFTIFKTPAFIRMNEAQIIENFYGIRLDLASLALAVYLSDVASLICVGESGGEGQILKLLLNTLYIISNKKMPNRLIKAVYELRILTKSGFMPSLDECEICSRRDFYDGFVFFDYIGGNLICGECLGKLNAENENEKENENFDEYPRRDAALQKKLARISPDVLDVMRFITGARDEKLFLFMLRDEDTANELSNICEKYLLEQLGMNIDSLKYYKNYEK